MLNLQTGLKLIFFLLSFILLVLQPAQAQVDLEKLQPPPVEEHLRELAVDGDTALIGGQIKDEKGSSVYIYTQKNGTWIRQAKLPLPPEKHITSAALSGNTAIIGAEYHDLQFTPHGVAYIFVRQLNGTWNLQATLQPPPDDTFSFFGSSVALSGDIAVIGAQKLLAPAFLETGGAAYIFIRQQDGTWRMQAKLQPPSEEKHSSFGASVALAGTTALVSVAPFQGIAGGEAYVFTRQESGNWIQEARLGKLRPKDDRAYAFAREISLKDSKTAIVHCGEVLYYIFARQKDGTWIHQETKKK